MSEPRTVLRGGMIVDGTLPEPWLADLAMQDGVITAVGEIVAEEGDVVFDATGRYLMPGFIDTHSHADGAVFRDDVQRALLKQGVTTVIAGQDGVSYAPGDGAYAAEYFAALNGAHPSYQSGGVETLLAGYDGTTPVNVGYLVPAGTVRHEVKGYEPDEASPDEVASMRALVKQGLDEGALGLSTGLDYVPGIHQNTAELIQMSAPVAAAGGIYVTHMRGGYEGNSRLGTDEVAAIAGATGVRAHISHYHGPSHLLLDLVDELAGQGVNISFDAYPYRRGCSLLAMPILPPALLSGPRAEVLAALNEPAERRQLLDEWFPALEANPLIGPEWPDNLALAHIASAEYDWAHGMSVRDAAARAGSDPATFVLDLLVAAQLEVSVVMTVRDQRPYDDLARIITHPAHMVGSDAIYIGKHPHPRGRGTYAKFLRLFTRERGDYSWADAARHLSGQAAEQFGLVDRGRLEVGCAADVVLVDPERVSDEASYESPLAEAVGIDDVFVGGRQVLAAGRLTGVNSGRGLRRGVPVPSATVTND
ncbi:MAG: amidohydrolase family protein [Actinomycetales bacterium]|nr:amidohydrolase family protein [Actinomycetales bacterium]